MGWEELKDQGTVSRLLQNSLAQGRVAHAYLFLGPDPESQLKAAVLLAQAVNCESCVPCGGCRSCRLITAKRHPDVEIIEPEGRFLRLDQIRTLCRRAGTTALVGKTKVYIVREAGRLLPEAANHLLKTLEEPPAGTIFILCAHHGQTLLPTIVSRCQEIVFQPLPPETIRQQLQATGSCSPDQAHLMAYLAGGDPMTAEEWIDDEALARLTEFVRLIQQLPQGKNVPFTVAEVFAAAPEHFLPLLAAWYRDLLVCHSGGKDVYHRGQQDNLAAMASLYCRRQLLACNKAIEKTSQLIFGRINVNVRLTLEALLVQLIPE